LFFVGMLLRHADSLSPLAHSAFDLPPGLKCVVIFFGIVGFALTSFLLVALLSIDEGGTAPKQGFNFAFRRSIRLARQRKLTRAGGAIARGIFEFKRTILLGLMDMLLCVGLSVIGGLFCGALALG